MTISEFLKSSEPLSVTVTFGFLCFNTKEISLECFAALLIEAERLETKGVTVHIAIRDNGNDGTWQAIREQYGQERTVHISHSEGVNKGQSFGRNELIQMAIILKSDFILFVDGDIQVVPLSSYVMASYMIPRPNLGCLSAHPVRQTTDPAIASKAVFDVERIQNDITTGCTGYAMFRCGMFLAPTQIGFEQTGPFAGPGWGLEDDDIYLQIIMHGWSVSFFTGMVYLQKKLRSSWPALYRSGYNIRSIFNSRKDFFLQKWANKGVDPVILLKVKAQEIPEYVPDPTEKEIGYRTVKWGTYDNLECLQCQYSTLWPDKMEKHLAEGKHPWAYPGQYSQPEVDESKPVY